MEQMTIIEVVPRQVLELSILVLWLGMYLTKKINFLSDYNIPAPVTGGIICSIIVALLNVIFDIQINFDLALRDMLLLVFFSTIGLSANLRLLLEGGKARPTDRAVRRSYDGASAASQTGMARNQMARSETNSRLKGNPAVIDQVHSDTTTPAVSAAASATTSSARCSEGWRRRRSSWCGVTRGSVADSAIRRPASGRKRRCRGELSGRGPRDGAGLRTPGRAAPRRRTPRA